MSLITQADISYVRDAYPDVQIKSVSRQEQALIEYHFRGMPASDAAREVGMTVRQARHFLRKESTRCILDYLREREFEDVRIDRDRITAMFLEAYGMAGTAGEKVMAAKELGKLHGLYPENRSAASVTVNQTTINNNPTDAKQVRRLSDDDLLKIAGLTALNQLQEQDNAIADGEFVECAEDKPDV